MNVHSTVPHRSLLRLASTIGTASRCNGCKKLVKGPIRDEPCGRCKQKRKKTHEEKALGPEPNESVQAATRERPVTSTEARKALVEIGKKINGAFRTHGNHKTALQPSLQELTDELLDVSIERDFVVRLNSQPSDALAIKHKALILLMNADCTGAHRALQGSGFADPSSEEVKEKFPLIDAVHNFQAPAPVPDFADLEVKDLRNFIKYRRGGAVGPDGMAANVVFKLVEKDQAFALALARIFTFWIQQGLLTTQQILKLTIVHVIALDKPNGGFRPIGVGTGLSRLFLGVLARRVIPAITMALHEDDQTGKRQGSEVYAQVVFRACELGWTIISADRSNAFNNMPVTTAQDGMEECNIGNGVVELVGYNAFHMVQHKEEKLACVHIPQGAPAGTALAAIIVGKCINPIRDEHPDALLLSLVDDTTVIAKDEDEALEVSEKVEAGFKKEGLPSNPSKRKIINNKNGVTAKIGGAYVGSEAQTLVDEHVQRFVREMDLLGDIVHGAGFTDRPIRHTAVRMVTHNILPSVNDFVRRNKYAYTARHFQEIDEATLRCLGKILSLDSKELKEIAPRLWLPVRNGGFGFVNFSELGVGIRLGALSAIVLTVRDKLQKCGLLKDGDTVSTEIPELIDAFKQRFGSNSEDDSLFDDLEKLRAINALEKEETEEDRDILVGLASRLRRRAQSQMVREWLSSIDLDNLVLREKVNSATTREANVFLNVVLKDCRHLQIKDREFVTVFRQRALLRMLPSGPGVCTICKDQYVDDYAEHFMKCEKMARGAPHRAVELALKSVITSEFGESLGVTVKRNPSLVEYKKPGVRILRPGSKEEVKNPMADIAICDINNQRTVIIDVRTCAMTYPQSENQIGNTVLKGEKDKKDHYNGYYDFPEGVRFIPFVVDTHGRWNSEFKDYVRELCMKKAQGDKHSSVYALAMANVVRVVSVAHARAVGERLSYGIRRFMWNARDDVVLRHCSRVQ